MSQHTLRSGSRWQALLNYSKEVCGQRVRLAMCGTAEQLKINMVHLQITVWKWTENYWSSILPPWWHVLAVNLQRGVYRCFFLFSGLLDPFGLFSPLFVRSQGAACRASPWTISLRRPNRLARQRPTNGGGFVREPGASWSHPTGTSWWKAAPPDFWQPYIGVFKNRGTPKWMVYNGKPY